MFSLDRVGCYPQAHARCGDHGQYVGGFARRGKLWTSDFEPLHRLPGLVTLGVGLKPLQAKDLQEIHTTPSKT